MKKRNNFFALLLAIFLFTFSCEKKKEEISDLEKIRSSSNKKSYPATKMDSVQAIAFITKQKVQELLDLSILYTNGNRDTEIDSVIYGQIGNYFAKDDSTKLNRIFQEIDTLQVKSAKVGDLQVLKKVERGDTLDFAHFTVEYFDRKNRSIGNFEKKAQYVLQLSPVKFKKEFKFYFVDFDVKPKDSTSVGVTR